VTEPVTAPPEIGSAQPYLSMRAMTDTQRELLYIKLWGEVGARREAFPRAGNAL
jgi:hypothetical protein